MVFVLLSHLFGQNAAERLRLIHADVLRRETVAGKVIQKLEGNVEFQQGKMVIHCDVATQLLQEKEYALIGSVQIARPGESLVADTVYVYEREKKQVASGRVLRITDKDSTFSDRMTFFEKENKLLSDGHVRVVSLKDGTTLTGGRAEYLRDKELATIWHEPVLLMYDSLGTQTTRIVADTMEILQSGQKTIAIGSVEITQKNAVASCTRAEYLKEEQTISLNGTPRVVQKSQTISGDSLQLFLQDSKLSRADVKGNALAVSEAETSNPGRWQNKFTGQHMEFQFEDEKIRRVEIEDQATSTYHIIENDEYKGKNEISGDKIVIEFEDGEVKSVVVKSDPDVAEGKFLPPKR